MTKDSVTIILSCEQPSIIIDDAGMFALKKT